MSPDSIQLVGPKYNLLRDEFFKNTTTHQQDRILIFFGGSDPNDLTGRVLKILNKSSLSTTPLDVVIGSNNDNRHQIEELISLHPSALLHVQVENMKELLAKAKLAVGAGGVNTLERIAVGVPSVVITTADNQLPSIKQLHKNGVVLWVGHFNEVSDRDICLTIERTIQDLGKIKKRILKEKNDIKRGKARTRKFSQHKIRF